MEALPDKFTNLTLYDLQHLKLKCDDAYYNSDSPILSDHNYDLLVDLIYSKDPNFNNSTGFLPDKKQNRMQLPVWMGSMDKIKSSEPNKIANWLLKNKVDQYVIEEKLDGVSCLLQVKNNIIKLFTRGNGKIGSDISHLVNLIKNIPVLTEDIIVRGELIIPKQIFDSKYAQTFKNMRNMVSGVIGRKTAHSMVSDIHFVAYEIISSNKAKQISPSVQLRYLRQKGFECVFSEETNEITLDFLMATLILYKESSKYDIDGIIIHSDINYIRTDEGNPKYAFAFKMQRMENQINSTIKNVIWEISKWGKLKPVVEIEPIQIQGITISRATAHNAKFIFDHNIGPGTVATITRSGDVIPAILKIVKSSELPQMPTNKWEWDKYNVDIVSTEDNTLMHIKSNHSFFADIGVKDLGIKTITAFYQNDLTTIYDISTATIDTFVKIEGFGIVKATKIHTNIKNVLNNLSLPVFLAASGVFGCGIGIKTVESLFVVFNPLEYDKEELHKMITEIPNFSDKTALSITQNIQKAKELYQTFLPITNFTTKNKLQVSHNTLLNKKIVFSGFRNKSLEDNIIKNGGKVSSKISGKTDFLIVDDKEKNYSSIVFAKNNNITIYDQKELELLL